MPRRGAHLTEVLISLVIMSIGLISTLSLFTASVDRAAIAAKKTRAADLRHNAESAIDINPAIVRNPDRSQVPNAHAGETFVFDPFGLAILGNPKFGNLTRYAGDYQTLQAADAICVEQDSWVAQWESLVPVTVIPSVVPVVGGTPYIEITLPVAIAMPPANSTSRLRISMISTGWDHEESRIPVSAVIAPDGKSTTFSWWRDSPATGNPGKIDSGEGSLPDGIVTTLMVSGQPVKKIGKVKVELSERRFSWLASVARNAGNDCRVNIAVYFSRSFDPTDDLVFPCLATQGSGSIVISAPSDRLKAGQFVFDADNAWWYRITKVSGSTALVDPPLCADCKNVVLPRGIVDVFSIRTK